MQRLSSPSEAGTGQALGCPNKSAVRFAAQAFGAQQSDQCSCFLLQWSYGFYLIHLQGKQGFQFFCKTEEMKRKWMEQFEMAM